MAQSCAPQCRGHVFGNASGCPAKLVKESGETKIIEPTTRFEMVLRSRTSR